MCVQNAKLGFVLCTQCEIYLVSFAGLPFRLLSSSHSCSRSTTSNSLNQAIPSLSSVNSSHSHLQLTSGMQSSQQTSSTPHSSAWLSVGRHEDFLMSPQRPYSTMPTTHISIEVYSPPTTPTPIMFRWQHRSWNPSTRLSRQMQFSTQEAAPMKSGVTLALVRRSLV